MGANDGDGDFWGQTESYVTMVLKEKGITIDYPINPWALLREVLGLSEKDLCTVLGRALFENRLEEIRSLDDLSSLLESLNGLLHGQEALFHHI